MIETGVVRFICIFCFSIILLAATPVLIIAPIALKLDEQEAATRLVKDSVDNKPWTITGKLNYNFRDQTCLYCYQDSKGEEGTFEAHYATHNQGDIVP